MLRKLPLFPFFFLLYPFLHFWAVNDERGVHFSKLILPFLLSFLLMLGIWGVLAWIYRNSARASLAVFLMIFIFFSYGHFYLVYLGSLPYHPRLIAGVFIFIFFLIPFVFRMVPFSAYGRKGGVLLNYLNLFSILVCFIPVTKMEFQNIFFLAPQEELVPESLPAASKRPRELPDIYYIVLDEYGRADVLQKTFGFDNRPFLDFLKQKGFFVAEKSHSNYALTIYSLPSSMNFELFKDDVWAGVDKIHYARLIRFLKQLGYRYVSVNSGVTMTESAPLADQWISFWGVDDFLLGFVNSTLLRAFSVLLLSESWRARHLYNFGELRKLPSQPGPKLVFAHMLIPHPPMVFKADGSLYGGVTMAITPRGWIKNSIDRYTEGYPGQLQYLNVLLKDLVEALISNSKVAPIIVLQSDHGIDPLTDYAIDPLEQNFSQDEALWKRMANFTAVYAEPEALKHFYSEITPVNIFPLLLDHYFGTGLGTKEDRLFVTQNTETFGWLDVTDRVMRFKGGE